MRHALALLPMLPLLLFATRGISPWFGLTIWVAAWAIAVCTPGTISDDYDSREAFRSG